MSNVEGVQRHGDGKGDGSLNASKGDDASSFAETDNQHLRNCDEPGSPELHKDAAYYENLAKEDRKKVAACTDPDLSLLLREVAIIHEREARKLRREEREGTRLASSRRRWANFR